MADDDATTPSSAPMLNSQEGCRPVEPDLSHPRTQREDWQRLLFYMAFVAVCGVIVEACFIYRLHTIGVPNAKETDAHQSDSQEESQQATTPNPLSKPMAHLIASKKKPGKDGIMVWESVEEGDNFDEVIMRDGMKYNNGRIIIPKDGYYSVYSKLYLKEPNNHMILHSIVKTNIHISFKILLLRSKQFRRKGDFVGTTNSYLEGVFHLIKNDAIFVTVNNHTQIILERSADNYFGVYML